jgi:hypothetical protein
VTEALADISIASSGTTTIPANQYKNPILVVDDVTLTGPVTIVFPNAAARWTLILANVTGLNDTNTLTIQSGSATATLTTGAGANIGSTFSVIATGANGLYVS